jgi:hypothetical protein
MRFAIAIVAAVTIATGAAHAQPGQQEPPPVFKVVNSTDKNKGVIAFRYTVNRAVPVQKEIVVIENGQQVKRTVVEHVWVAEERLMQIDAAKSRIITPDGKQLPIDEVWNRVKANSVVVVSGNGQPPAQAYLRALNAETIVIIPPPGPDEARPPKKE